MAVYILKHYQMIEDLINKLARDQYIERFAYFFIQ